MRVPVPTRRSRPGPGRFTCAGLLLGAFVAACPSARDAAAAGPTPAGERAAAAEPSSKAEPLTVPWTTAADSTPLAARIPPPPGFRRLPAAPGSFADWLRRLPVKAGRPPVRLFDGRLKSRQDVHHAVLDLDVGRRDLQQCADAVMRLRAEWLWSAGRADDVCFRFTSGDPARWSLWRAGQRPKVSGSRVRWVRSAAPDRGRPAFRRYLDTVFTYAGSASLSRELSPVRDPARVEPGDVFIRGGHPGHAVLVLDVAEDDAGTRVFLLAQSYMPAQEVHVLRNPGAPTDPWYAVPRGRLVTPEWTFAAEDLMRFSERGCPER